MAKRDGAASIQGEAIRITPLNIDGTIDATRPILTTNGFISASFTTEFETGDDISEKAADGHICISYKSEDSLKDITFALSLCSPDPESAALIAGGKIILACEDVLLDPTQPPGTNNPPVVVAGDVVGYSSPAVGALVGNPVAIEIWSKAIVGGKPALGQPYWHWAFPYVRVRYDGTREFSNGALTNEYTGTGVGNESLVPAGLNPVNPTDDFVPYRNALVNPFSYVRSSAIPPMGWTGGTGGTGEWTTTPDNSITCAITAVKGAVTPGMAFPAEPTVTAEDAANAAKLAALGYVVAPPGAAWATGESFSVGTFKFHWDGTAWAPAAAAMAARAAAPAR